MPRVYSHDFNRYFTPKYTIANNVKIGSGLGNEYFKRTNYSTLYDQAQQEQKQFSQIPTAKDGEGIVDTVANIGKTALDFANKNKELLSAVGSIAGAASQISRAADSAKQLEAIKRIQQIRQLNMKDEDRPNDNKEVKTDSQHINESYVHHTNPEKHESVKVTIKIRNNNKVNNSNHEHLHVESYRKDHAR